MSDTEKFKNIYERIDKNETLPYPKNQLFIRYVGDINKWPMIRNNARSGIIVYTYINDNLFFVLGVDNESKALTDFGGGIKKTENFIRGGLREFYEESLEIFGKIDEKIINDSLAIFTCEMCIIFIKMSFDFGEIKDIFMKELKNLKDDNKPIEVSDIKLISKENFYNLINKGNNDEIYHRVTNLLSKAKKKFGDFTLFLNL